MKKLTFSILTVFSLSLFARDERKPRRPQDPQFKVCMQELKKSGELSETCQAYFQQKEERKQKIQECIAQIDGTVPADDTTTDVDTDTDTDTDTVTDTTVDDASIEVE